MHAVGTHSGSCWRAIPFTRNRHRSQMKNGRRLAARQLSAKKPKDLRYTLRMLLSYMGRHKFLLLAVAILVAVSALNSLGTYMIRPIVNNLVVGNVRSLVTGVAATAAIYGTGALSAYGYTQIMVKAAQRVLFTYGETCSHTFRACRSSSLTPGVTGM